MQKPIHNDSSAFGLFAPHGFTAMVLAITRRCTASWGGKRRAFFLRNLAIKVLRGKPLDVEAFGAKMRLYPIITFVKNGSSLRHNILTRGTRPAQSRITDDFIFINIGANIGGYTLFVAAHAGPRARILAIERSPIFSSVSFTISGRTASPT